MTAEGVAQTPNVDFDVSGTSLRWDNVNNPSTDLDGLLAAGDVLVVSYSY
jgi:hypothetical protein